MRPRVLFLALAVVLLTASCASDDGEQTGATGDEQAVEEVVRASIAAENDKNVDAFLALWTDEGLREYDVGSREDLKEGKSENFGADKATIVDISGTTVADGEASTTVDATLGEHHLAAAVNRIKLELIQREGEWVINGFEYVGGAPPAEGTEVVDLRAQEYEFDLESDEVPADFAFKFANVGEEPHEITLFKGPDDLTIEKAAEDLKDVDGAELHNAPDGYEVEHLSFAEPDKTVDVSFAEPLITGTYVLACYIPEGGFPEEGQPDPNAKSHFELGMRALLTVK